MLTQWNSPKGPGGSYRTVAITVKSCLGDPDFPFARPPESYTITPESTTVEATAQADVTSDDRFQRMARVHLSGPSCMMPQPAELVACGMGTRVFEDDIASVWTITLLSATPESGTPAVPDIQIRIIQAMNGVQIKRATVKYKGPFAPGYVVQLHGVESTDLEIWAWINPADASLTAKVALIFGVSVKMRPSSVDDVILDDNVVPIP